ncbi:GNAT family N-acetyltransferase [Sphingomonas naphthae]|uniref:GNAT family N-acetyltransferase n=1 Tax=Sphingomonas naphthae TaxID=1813468 RepID=A0ABY7THA3_9SPHN|nr:GNAT family N-acetyltransferase [Sphingomonas naphthae]WCT72330.1 GNAT family N-acetyltransferase [Sphingomonas naphthae]
MTDTVRNNATAQRYELAVPGGLAIAAYSPEGDVLAFTHTEVPEALEGQGIASRLVKGALADVRARGLKIRPACAFVAAYVERHPEVRDLVATGI